MGCTTTYYAKLISFGLKKIDLIKSNSDLSGKKWDAAMKGLAKHGLVKVSLVEDKKIAELAG
jgi:lysyl-tRNA synthetase class 2